MARTWLIILSLALTFGFSGAFEEAQAGYSVSTDCETDSTLTPTENDVCFDTVEELLKYFDADDSTWKAIGPSGTRVDARSFGVVCDGAADTTTEFQAMLDTLTGNMTNSGQPHFVLPAGECQITAQLTIPANAGSWSMSGAGFNATVIKWEGGSGGSPMFLATNMRDVVWQDFSIEGDAANVPSHALQIDIDSTNLVPAVGPTRNHFVRVRFGDPTERVVKGVAFTASNTDQNNDLSRFIDCTLNGSTYGLSIEHSNSLLHQIYGGNISGDSAAVNTVPLDDTSQGGSFVSFGTQFSSASGGTQFRLAYSSHPTIINDPIVEDFSGSKLLVTPVVSGTAGHFGSNAANEDTSIGVVIRGGSVQLANLGAPNYHVEWDASQDAELLIDGLTFKTASAVQFGGGMAMSLPNSFGGKITLRNTSWGFQDFDYNSEVLIDGHVEGGDDLSNYNNLGDGTLIIQSIRGATSDTETCAFADGDATPSVEVCKTKTFVTANTSPTTITTLDNTVDGVIYTIVADDNDTTIQNGSGINLKDNEDFIMTDGDTLTVRQIDLAGSGLEEIGRVQASAGTSATASCADTGDGSLGALTLDPSVPIVRLSNLDSDGCNVTMGDTNAVVGRRLSIRLESNAGGTVNFADVTNVFDGQAPSMDTAGDLLLMEFVNGSYFQMAFSFNNHDPLDLNCAAGEVVVDPRYVHGALVEGSCAAN